MNTPESVKGLKTFSKKFLNDILKLNLKTPPDVVTGLVDTQGIGAYSNYQDDLGNDSVINNYKVKNPGSIDSTANTIRKKLFGKNRPLSQSDFSELGNIDSLGYTYYALTEDIGKLAQLSDYTVPSLRTVANQFDLSSAESIKVNVLNNRFIPETIETFETKVIKNNNPQQPYVDDNGQLSNGFEPQQLTPGDILSLNVNSNYNYSDDPISYLKYSGNVLQNETLLMNIAALELRSALDYRINQARQITNTAASNINDAMTNPLMAINIIKDPKNYLIGKNYNITVPQNVIGKAEQVIGSLTGTYDVVEYLNLDRSVPLTPTSFESYTQNTKKDKTAAGKFIDDLFGKSVKLNQDTALLNNTGSGQKFQLFSNLYFNKYAPNYDPKYQSGVFQAIDSALQSIGAATGFLGLTGGKRPSSRYYYGSRSLNAFDSLTDQWGNQIGSPDKLVKNFATEYDDDQPVKIYKSEYEDMASYGSISTDFVWGKQGYTESFQDLTKPSNPNSKILIDRIDEGNLSDLKIDDPRYSYQKEFKEGSLLWKTQKLLDNADPNSGINLAIAQTKTKFFDGMSLYSKGSGVITPLVEPLRDAQGNKIGNKYTVPGLDINGKRDPGAMNSQSEFCRTWTKARPYMGITNTMRYSELIRLERNSVIDNYGNYNIFPSKLNITKNTNRQNEIFSKYGVQNNITEETAKKYMLSIENLAWRDSTYLKPNGDNSLPSSERGPNGGRIMWFPPYDLKFTDDSTANWTTHQFLGRAEPIYTYNNTERSGTLSFKIVVDHPTILNVLVKRELKDLKDETVDEILNAFWSGCVNFDIYELARIWDKFSTADISYFEKVIAGLDGRKSNSEIVRRVDESGAKTPTESIDKNLTTQNNITPISGSLFFENDVPLLKDASSIKTFDEYFDTYVKLNQGDTSVENSSKQNGKVNIGNYIYYDRVIGSNSTEKYFSTTSQQPGVSIYNLYQAYPSLQTNLIGITTPGNNVNINLSSFTSSLDQQNQEYNKELAIRRFKSVAKWIILKVLSANQSTIIKNKNGDKIDATNIDTNFIDDGSITLYRNSGSEGHDDQINIRLTKTEIVNPLDAMKNIGGITYINPNNVTIPGVNTDIPVVLVSYSAVPSPEAKTYVCTDTFTNKNLLLGKTIKINDVSYTLTNDNFGCLVPSKQDTYTEADVVCSVTSIYASYNRRVDLEAVLTPNNNIQKDETVQTTKQLLNTNVENTTPNNITKREIAQKILNKLITEEDYFEALEANSPTVFKTIAEKLKYFTPAFHSTTPEGLNSRLTFLQQCLRPGDTITTSDKTVTDARNTSFGKPPVCILRIGDFYNTKIIINSLNISYEPLIFDLNPEGIGVQPMIANVVISFKYIGGSGLRQYVNKLQNALSFNYYANADVYESRSFANTDPLERELINSEVNPFNKNTLDLIPIVAKNKQINNNDQPFNQPTGTLGEFVLGSDIQEYLGANEYSMAKNTATVYNTTTVYEPGVFATDDSTGLYGKNYWKRLFDDKLNNSVLANVAGKSLNDTSAWQPVVNKNFGQQYYLNIYGNESYLTTIKLSYENIFKKTYNNYITNINNYLDFISFDNKITNKNKFLLHNILNKNYTGDTKVRPNMLINFAADFALSKNYMKTINQRVAKKEMNLTPTISNYFDVKATNKNYVNYLTYSEKNMFGRSDYLTDPMKLYLYPQSLFYVNPSYNNINQKTSILSGTTYNPGYFTDGENGQKSDVANIYIKNNIKTYDTNNIITYFYDDITQKINNDLLVFWYSDVNVLNNYITDTSEPQKEVFKKYINTKLTEYKNKLLADYLDLTVKNDTNNQEFYVNLTGISCVVNGYDASYVNGVLTKYAVIPNESKITTVGNGIFGYDPYDKTSKILLITGSTYNYEDYLVLNNVKSTISTATSNVDQFMLNGNNLYMYRQISASDSVIGSGLIGNNTLYSTVDGNTVLPKSIAIDYTTSIGNDDYNFTITGSTGENKITFDNFTDVTTTEFDLLTASIGNVSDGAKLTKRYKMTYTFEKMSYEVLDFSNKTLGVVLNDNSDNYGIDITTKNLDLLKNRFISVLSLTGDEVKIYDVLFPNTNDGFYYYSVTGNTTDNSYKTSVDSLSTVLDYSVSITNDLVDYRINNTPNIDTAVRTKLNSIKGQMNNFVMSSLSEAIYLEFFEDIYKNRTTYLNEIMKKISDDLKSSKKSDKEKEREIAKVRSAFSAFFEQINSYLTKINTSVNTVVTSYDTNVTTPLKLYVSSAFGTPNNKSVAIRRITASDMLRGNDKDYILTLRKLTTDTPDMMNNIMIYNKNRK